jgi:Ran GTPase-activating protein (RanGAP) involved in mRNA processing and transport
MVLSEDVVAMTFTSGTSPSLAIDGMLMDSATIASVLREATKRSHVIELTLRNVAIDDVVAIAAEELFGLQRQWTKLDLIHCTGFIHRIVQASITKMQQFSFTGSVPIAHNPRYSLDVASLRALGSALQDCPRLTLVSLKGTRLSRAGLASFCDDGLAKSTSLQTLQMSHVALEANHVSLLSNALAQNQHLTALSLAHCKFGLFSNNNHNNNNNNTNISNTNNGMAANNNADDVNVNVNANHNNNLDTHSSTQFATLLESLVPHPTLESLNIYGIYCNEQSTQALSQLLRTSSCLWHLGLKNNLRHPEDKLTVTNLINALQDNTQLTYLQLSGNNVDNADMEALSRILTHNTTLRALSLTANAIGDDGLLSVATRLPDMKALRYLDVQRNKFSERSKGPIVQALQENMELERLDLDGTWDALKSYYLSLNKGGRRLLQSSNNCPLSLWPLVLERANTLPFGRNQPHANVNVLYCLLLQGPVLFQPRTTTTKTITSTNSSTSSSNNDKRRSRRRIPREEQKEEKEERPPAKRTRYKRQR